MTIGGLLEALGSYEPTKKITKLDFPHSYRGYYSDLALESTNEIYTVQELIDLIKCESLGKVFEGYKGGDFTMIPDTPVWISTYGCCGFKIMSIKDGDILTFETKED